MRTASALSATLLLLTTGTTGLAGQTTNPPYLAEMPSVERVLREIRGADADETAARQMGTFIQLRTIIEQLAGPRQVHNQLTPDEKRLIGLYASAQWQIAQSKPEYQRLPAMRGYDASFKWRDEVLNRFFSPSFRATYQQVTGQLAAHRAERAEAAAAERRAVAARAESTERAMATSREVRQASGQQSPGRALARCLSAGRSENQCLSEGLVNDFKQQLAQILPGGKDPPRGIRLSGVYTGQRGISITFWDQHAVVECGGLVPDNRRYSVDVADGRILVSVGTSPELVELVQGPSAPVVLTLGSGSQLTGPADAEIRGRRQIGTRTWTRIYDDGRRVPMEEAVFAPGTARCGFGALALTGPSPVGGTAADGLAVSLDLILGGREGPPLAPAPTGLRMLGEYGTPVALDLEFHPRGVVLGCGDAVLARHYDVRVDGGQVRVRVQHEPTPLVLTLRPDGALAGSGEVTVSGRVLTGLDAGDRPVWAPMSATCRVGLLPPAGDTAALAAATASLTVAGGTPATPGRAAPLAGAVVFLLRESLSSLLPGLGFPAAPGGAPLVALAAACQRQAPECGRVIMSLGGRAVASLRIGADGAGEFTRILLGSYFVAAFGAVGEQVALWDLPVEVRPGANAVTLDLRTAVRER